MLEKEIKVKLGLDASKAALFVQTASKYKSSITIKSDNKVANAKSIMGIISLGLIDDCEIVLNVDGEDEAEAIQALENFMN